MHPDWWPIHFSFQCGENIYRRPHEWVGICRRAKHNTWVMQLIQRCGVNKHVFPGSGGLWSMVSWSFARKWLTMWKCKGGPVHLAHSGGLPPSYPPTSKTHNSVSQQVCNYLKKTKNKYLLYGNGVWAWQRGVQPANWPIKCWLHLASKPFGAGVPMGRTTISLTFVAPSGADSTTEGVSMPVWPKRTTWRTWQSSKRTAVLLSLSHTQLFSQNLNRFGYVYVKTGTNAMPNPLHQC